MVEWNIFYDRVNEGENHISRHFDMLVKNTYEKYYIDGECMHWSEFLTKTIEQRKLLFVRTCSRRFLWICIENEICVDRNG